MKTILEGYRDADGRAEAEVICSTSVPEREKLTIFHLAKANSTDPDKFPKGFKKLALRPVAEDHSCEFAVLIEKPSANTIERTSKSKKIKPTA